MRFIPQYKKLHIIVVFLIAKFYFLVIQHEYHFLLKCASYTSTREKLINKVQSLFLNSLPFYYNSTTILKIFANISF